MLVDEISQRWSGLGLCISLCLLQLQEVEVKQDTPSGHPKPFSGSFVALQAEVTQAQEHFQVQIVDLTPRGHPTNAAGKDAKLLVPSAKDRCKQRTLGAGALWAHPCAV